jgi:hypothetical protein
MTSSNAYVTFGTLAGQQFHKGSRECTMFLQAPATPVTLQREPTNKYDSNAIKVLVEEAHLPSACAEAASRAGGEFPLFLGYIDRASARELARRIDGGEIAEATLDTVVSHPTVRVIIRT